VRVEGRGGEGTFSWKWVTNYFLQDHKLSIITTQSAAHRGRRVGGPLHTTHHVAILCHQHQCRGAPRRPSGPERRTAAARAPHWHLSRSHHTDPTLAHLTRWSARHSRAGTEWRPIGFSPSRLGKRALSTAEAGIDDPRHLLHVRKLKHPRLRRRFTLCRATG